MASTEQQIAEALADPTVPRRGVSGIDRSLLTPQERARLVVVDPYANGREARLAAAGAESIELEFRRGGYRRVRVPCATREQRDRIVRVVEDGDAVFVGVRPDWYAQHQSGRYIVHEWPEPMERLAPAQDVVAQAAALYRAQIRSAARAQAEYAAAHDVPAVPAGGRGSVYRNPFAG